MPSTWPTPGDYGFTDVVLNSGTFNVAGTYLNIRRFEIKSGVVINVKPWDGADVDNNNIPTSDTGHLSIFARDIVIRGTIDASGAGYGAGGGGGHAPAGGFDSAPAHGGPGGPGGPGAQPGIQGSQYPGFAPGPPGASSGGRGAGPFGGVNPSGAGGFGFSLPDTVTGVVAVLAPGGLLTSGVPYYYVVSAFFPNGQEGFVSSQVFATPTGGNLSIQLTWTGVFGAAGYRIYRSTTSGVYTTPSFLVSTNGLTYTDGSAFALSPGAPIATTVGVNFDTTTDASVSMGSGGSGGQGASGGLGCDSCNFGSPSYGGTGGGGAAGFSGGGILRLVASGSIRILGTLRSKDGPHGDGQTAGDGGDGNASGSSTGGGFTCSASSCGQTGGDGGPGAGGSILLQFLDSMSQVIGRKRVEISGTVDNRSHAGVVNGGSLKIIGYTRMETGTLQTGRLYNAEGPRPFGQVVS